MTIWQVENGQSIQAVIVGAADGDTIVVDAGTYAESLTIDKAVTILGANAGIAGTATRGAETIITGHHDGQRHRPGDDRWHQGPQYLQQRHAVHWRERPHRRRCHHREQRLLLDWSQWHQ